MERRYIKAIEVEVAALLHGSRSAADIARPLMAMIDGFWLQSLLYPRGFVRREAIATCLAFIDARLAGASRRLPRRGPATSLAASA